MAFFIEKMNLHELNVYNKTYVYVGAIFMSVGTYFSTAKNTDNIYTFSLLIVGILCMLMAMKKPKEKKEQNSN